MLLLSLTWFLNSSCSIFVVLFGCEPPPTPSLYM